MTKERMKKNMGGWVRRGPLVVDMCLHLLLPQVIGKEMVHTVNYIYICTKLSYFYKLHFAFKNIITSISYII
jgi:hypothetical protein